MTFTKDYKLLYEATKLDLKDQIEHSADLDKDLSHAKEELSRVMTSDTINLRERIAMEVSHRGWHAPTAQTIYDWIVQATPQKVPSVVSHGMASASAQPKGKRGRPRKLGLSNKPKRKYTKKSKFWSKKKKK